MSTISNRDRIIYSMVQLEILRDQLRICAQSGFVEQPNMVDQVHHPGNYNMGQDMDFSHHHFNNQVSHPPPQANLVPPPSQMKATSASKKSKGKKNEVQNQAPQQQFNLNDL